MNYTELKANVARWIDRTDIDGEIDTFINMVESRLQHSLLVVERLQRATLQLSKGVSKYSLPSDTWAIQRIAIESGRALDEVAPATRSNREYPAGMPSAYSFHGEYIDLWPVPNGDVCLEVVYYESIEPLTSANDSNFVLDKFSDLYLFGCLEYAAIFINDKERVAMFKSEFEQRLQTVLLDDHNKRYAQGTTLQTWVT